MDMELQRIPLEGFRPVYQAMLRQEETLESIVSDAMPDIGRIVACRGTPVLRQKELLDGCIRVSGTVRASVLYIPEGGGDPCCMSVNIPFVCNGDHPAVRPDGRAEVTLKLIGADARMLNPRKVLVRTEVGICAAVYGEERTELCTKAVCPEDAGLQTLWETHKDYAAVCLADKHISFSDVVRLSSVRPAVRQVLAWDGEIDTAEGKAIGRKVVVRGNASVDALCLCEGGVASHRFDLPFSQVVETGGVFEDCETEVTAILTGLRCQERGEGELEVTVEALIQLSVWKEREVGTVADLYSTGRVWEVQRAKVLLDELAEEGVLRQNVRQLCPSSVPVRQLVECRATVGETLIVPNGEEKMMAAAKLYISLLWTTEETGLESAFFALSSACDLPSVPGGKCVCRCVPVGEVSGTVVNGGVEVRLDLAFEYRFTRPAEGETVCSAKPGKGEPAGGRPSLRLRAAAEGERLWDIAKCCGSTVADILKANDMEAEDFAGKRLLLIPRSR